MATPREIDTQGLATRIGALPGFPEARAAARAAGVDAWLVGGAVRDALLAIPGPELDLVTEGDQLDLASRLGDPVRAHDRFLTATVQTARGPVDVARARREHYAHPGALPDVEPASIGEDLGRRDFTVNAIAVSLDDPGEPIDPHGGLADLRASVLRTLHPGSLADDPTRALRAARYSARLGLEPEPQTLAQITAADLQTVSADRVDAEIAKLAREADPRRGFELLDRWGVLKLPPGAGEAIDELATLLTAEPWCGVATPEAAIAAAVRGELAGAAELAHVVPERPSQGVEAASGHSGVELALARVLGAEWLDHYVAEWRSVRPRITGSDLLDAGVPQGPRVGAGLAVALRARLDGEASDRDAELALALAAAHGRD